MNAKVSKIAIIIAILLCLVILAACTFLHNNSYSETSYSEAWEDICNYTKFLDPYMPKTIPQSSIVNEFRYDRHVIRRLQEFDVFLDISFKDRADYESEVSRIIKKGAKPVLTNDSEVYGSDANVISERLDKQYIESAQYAILRSDESRIIYIVINEMYADQIGFNYTDWLP